MNNDKGDKTYYWCVVCQEMHEIPKINVIYEAPNGEAERSEDESSETRA